MRPLDAVRQVEADLASAGVPEPGVDAEVLVAHVLQVARSALSGRGEELGQGDVDQLRSLVRRRRTREPLQHVLGEWGFRRLVLGVDRRALVPRPETEIVVERCLALIARLPAPRVLDVGTGSGAIALALADEHRGAHVDATDASAPALTLARENARRTGLADRVRFAHGELFAGLDGPFDLVVSNPPYVPEEELASLEPEVRDHEPRDALVGPGVTQAVAREARAVLARGGRLVLEVGDGQARGVERLLAHLGYEEVTVTPDLAGRERVVDGRVAMRP
ncbi:MAG: peptide chain release factor N(5)-glutamine methyltransferase [Actinomycetota bacterium]|nr:peptide chain release factor N(5)-glutamine methyltransferase [Actinomycetota bacterium]